jgi:hypothetical protein
MIEDLFILKKDDFKQNLTKMINKHKKKHLKNKKKNFITNFLIEWHRITHKQKMKSYFQSQCLVATIKNLIYFLNTIIFFNFFIKMH